MDPGTIIAVIAFADRVTCLISVKVGAVKNGPTEIQMLWIEAAF
jgi:hypothetical protein